MVSSETNTIIETWESINGRWQVRRRTLLKKYGITANQFKVLQAVMAARRHQASNQRFIVGYTGFNKMVVSQTLDALMQKRLLWRIPSFPDTRKHTVKLGAGGKALLRNITPELQALEQDFLSDLTRGEHLALERLLSKLKP